MDAVGRPATSILSATLCVLGLRFALPEALRRPFVRLLRQRQTQRKTLRRPCGQLLWQRHTQHVRRCGVSRLSNRKPTGSARRSSLHPGFKVPGHPCAGFVSAQFSHVPMTSCEASNWALGLATQSSSSLLFPLLVWFVVLPGRWARGRRVLHFSRLSHLVFRRNAVSFLVLIPRCLLVFAGRQSRLVSLIVLVWQSSVRVHVRFLMVLVTELHTLRQCGVRASLVRVS